MLIDSRCVHLVVHERGEGLVLLLEVGVFLAVDIGTEGDATCGLRHQIVGAATFAAGKLGISVRQRLSGFHAIHPKRAVGHAVGQRQQAGAIALSVAKRAFEDRAVGSRVAADAMQRAGREVAVVLVAVGKFDRPASMHQAVFPASVIGETGLGREPARPVGPAVVHLALILAVDRLAVVAGRSLRPPSQFAAAADGAGRIGGRRRIAAPTKTRAPAPAADPRPGTSCGRASARCCPTPAGPWSATRRSSFRVRTAATPAPITRR